jgi:DNA-binding NarL/FixJ family response regulator
MMRVLLADDKVDLRSALRLLLEQEPGVELIDEVSDIDGLLAQVNRLHPDLLLLDWELTDIDTTGAGQRLLHVLHGQYPHLSVIVLSGRPESNRSVLAAGTHLSARASRQTVCYPHYTVFKVRFLSEQIHKHTKDRRKNHEFL